MTIADIFAILLLFCLILAGLYQLFSLFCVYEFFRKKKNGAMGPSSDVPVSIIKPLKGIDPELKENIATFCSQDYPEYEVLLGFSEQRDSAVDMMKEVAAASADPPVRVIISSINLGANKKVSNLQGLVESARHPLLAISDSDMRVDRFYLKKIVDEYYRDKNVGLVTCLYKITSPKTVGAALESLTIALDFTPSVLVARRLEGITFGLGASLLLSTKSLEEIGGLSAIADYLADDYQIGHRLWEKGYKIVLSDVVIENVVGPMSIRDYLMHQLRWAKTYRASRPKGFAGYGITHVFAFSLFLFILQGPTSLTISIICTALALRFGTATVMYRKVIRSKNWIKWLVIIPLKDILSFGVWTWCFLSRNVSWRGKSYKVLKGGTIRETGHGRPG
jgi:ceramide glucosyltransferase